MSLSLSQVTFVRLRESSKFHFALLLLLLSLSCCAAVGRRLKRRSPWTCLFIAWPIFGQEMQRQRLRLRNASSNMFEARSNLLEHRNAFAPARRCRVAHRVIMPYLFLCSSPLPLPLLLLCVLLMISCLLPIVVELCALTARLMRDLPLRVPANRSEGFVFVCSHISPRLFGQNFQLIIYVPRLLYGLCSVGKSHSNYSGIFVDDAADRSWSWTRIPLMTDRGSSRA